MLSVSSYQTFWRVSILFYLVFSLLEREKRQVGCNSKCHDYQKSNIVPNNNSNISYWFSQSCGLFWQWGHQNHPLLAWHICWRFWIFQRTNKPILLLFFNIDEECFWFTVAVLFSSTKYPLMLLRHIVEAASWPSYTDENKYKHQIRRQCFDHRFFFEYFTSLSQISSKESFWCYSTRWRRYTPS